MITMSSPDGIDYFDDVEDILSKVVKPDNRYVRNIADKLKILPRYAECMNCSQPRQFVIVQSWEWIHNNIDYKLSRKWKTPQETIKTGKGDCEDVTALLASLLLAGNVDDVRFIVGKYKYNGEKEWHTWIESNRRILDATSSIGSIVDSNYAKKAEYELEV